MFITFLLHPVFVVIDNASSIGRSIYLIGIGKVHPRQDCIRRGNAKNRSLDSGNQSNTLEIATSRRKARHCLLDRRYHL